MDIRLIIKQKYLPMCESIFAQSQDTFFKRVSDLIMTGLTHSSVYQLLNGQLKRESGAEVATDDFISKYDIRNNTIVEGENGIKYLMYYVNDIPDKLDISKRLLQYDAEFAKLILPHHQGNYKFNQRYVIDKILTDGQLMKCTDVHLIPVANFKGGFEYVLRYRRGLFLEEVPDNRLSNDFVEEIILDMLANRSSSSVKASKSLIATETRFSLIDPLYPARCELIKSIGGLGLVIRFFDFKYPFKIETLGLDIRTQTDLKKLSQVTSGLSVVTGPPGSGKGTTINAIALDIQAEGKYAIMSIDSPTEYLGRFLQVQYHTNKHLYDVCNATKKLNLDFVLLNEIATQETARQVFNCVASGMHVLTTFHSVRVYRAFYKMYEMLGDLYTYLIPYLNFISYQDKFSITCPSCTQKIHKDYYRNNQEITKLLEFYGLEFITQPNGCSECNHTGINQNGIQVVSEHIYFNDKIRDKLITMDIHTQSKYLKELLKESVNFEDVLKQKLIDGTVKVEEVISKIDSWK